MFPFEYEHILTFYGVQRYIGLKKDGLYCISRLESRKKKTGMFSLTTNLLILPRAMAAVNPLR